MSDLIMAIVCAVGVSATFISMLIIFPRKRGLAFTIIMFVVFTAILAIFMNFSLTRFLGSGIGLLYFPLMALLLRGMLFQKLFAFFMSYLLGLWQLRTGAAIAQIFAPYGSDLYYRLIFCIVMPCYIAYIVVIYLFGRDFFSKLFIHGRTIEWVLYTFGVMLSYLVMMRLSVSPVSDLPLFFLLMFFILWGFFILCFAIINTHEKAKQKSDAEFARSIVSSGRDHYQKMDELHDKLRIMRHDYKHHLNAARKMLNNGNVEEADQYLNIAESKLSEREMQSYCENTVINALVASFDERCEKMNIRFNVDIAILNTVAVPDYEMCIIIGNLMENAVEACEKLEYGRTIELAAQKMPEQLLLMVKNSFDGTIYHDDGAPVSKKTSGGFGLRSVGEVISRYDGDLHIEWDEDTFTAYAAVRL